MTRASRTFRPPLWATAGVMLGCGLFATAGLWQLDRAAEKRRLFSEFDASGAVTILDEPVADDAVEASIFQPLRVTGRYDPERQFLLDMMVYDGRVGYHVLTPLRREGRTVLVNRGWVDAGADRSVLPDIPVTDDDRDVVGLIAPLPRAGMQLAAPPPDPGTPWPRRLTFPSAGDIRAQLDYDVTGYQLLLDPTAADGYAREWRPALMSPEGHLSYAVQWFGLAIALAIIYVIVNLKRSPGDSPE